MLGKKQLQKVGKHIRDGVWDEEELKILHDWRGLHALIMPIMATSIARKCKICVLSPLLFLDDLSVLPQFKIKLFVFLLCNLIGFRIL